MKTFNISINLAIIKAIIFGFIFLSCDKDATTQNDLDGEWNLISFECCDLPKEEFNRNDIVWLYNTSKQNVTITNNTTIDITSQYNFTESGVYNIEIVEKEMTIYYKENEISYNYSISNDTLVLSNSPESDGSIIKFAK
ncbi:MAG: hypothetical protein WCX31_09175 [Salinivirgaceae bacterium]|jgi:hypothetical protein